jgi:hypothetical protein
MPKLVLFLFLSLLLSLPAFHMFEHFEQADCLADRKAQQADLHSIMMALSAALPSTWRQIDADQNIVVSPTAITARAGFLAPSGKAMIRVAAYRGQVARFFVRIGLGSEAKETRTIRGRPFKSFIARSGTLYVIVRGAVVIAISGNAGAADKALLSSWLDPGALGDLAYVTVSPTMGAPAC